MAVATLVTLFQSRMVQVEGHIQSAFYQDFTGSYLFDKAFRDFVVESAFLKIFIAWETFLENCFLSYSMANPSMSGLVYVRYARPLDEAHAGKMVVGTQKFIDWSNPTNILTYSKLYFESGEPFRSVISSINEDLLNLKSIRNAAVHLTSTTKTPLEALAARILGNPSPGISVSDLLLNIHPDSATNETVFAKYTKMLDAAVIAIAR